MNRRERTLLALALAVVGFVVPNTMIALFAVRHGLAFDGYFRHWGESLPATQLALDVSIAFVLLRERAVRKRATRHQPDGRERHLPKAMP